MITMSILDRVCIKVLGIYKLEALGELMHWAPLKFAFRIMAKILCSCLVSLMQSLSYMLWMTKC